MMRLFGRRQANPSDYGLYVPTMDGPLRPNDHLDRASIAWTGAPIDDLAVLNGELVFTSQNRLLSLRAEDGEVTLIKAFDRPITALSVAASGLLAVALFGEGLWLRATDNQWQQIALPEKYSACVTALYFDADDGLYCAIGSNANPISAWRRDLFERNSNGEILFVQPAQAKVRSLASGLQYPAGIVLDGNGDIIVAEAWAHRVVALSPQGAFKRTLLADLPAYPGRLSVDGAGHYLVSLFAPRRQIYEFILREPNFLQDMLAKLEEDEWVGPTYGRPRSANYPLLQGEVRQMGVMKPWAPSSSYGLVILCDGDFAPLESWHSRADGQMHGISAALRFGEQIIAASKGSGSLLMMRAGASDEH